MNSIVEMVNCYQQSALPNLELFLKTEGYEIVLFDGATVVDKESFLIQAAQDLPLDDGCQPKSWDGFVDCLWGGLYHMPAARVAIVWHMAHVLLESDLQTFLMINRLLSDIARSVSETEHGFSHEMQLVLFLLGEGAMFPALKSD